MRDFAVPWLRAAMPVGRHRDIDEFRVGEVKVIHDLDEFLQRSPATQSRVSLALLRYGTQVPVFIIMCRADDRFVGQREDFLMDRPV